MKNTEQKPDWWEPEYDKKFGFYTRNMAGTETCDEKKLEKDFIRNLLSQQEEQHKAEYKKCNKNLLLQQDEITKLLEHHHKEIKQLKQQHREELEGLLKGKTILSGDYSFGYNKAVNEINKAITNLLDKGEGNDMNTEYWEVLFDQTFITHKGSPMGRIMIRDSENKIIDSRRATAQDYKNFIRNLLQTISKGE